MKTNFHYKAMPAKIAQQTLRLMDKDYMSFFAMLKQKRNGHYNASVSPPKYKKSGAEFIITLPCDQVTLKNNILKLTKDIKLKFIYKIEGKIKQAIVKPFNHKYYMLYIQYDEIKKEGIKTLRKENFISIDLGINNLATCVSNVGHSFIMNGKPLKAYNQFYNKRKAKIQSELKKCNDKHYSNKIIRLNINRLNYIDNYLNQTVSLIVKQCIKYNVGSVIIGYNESWKKNINMGRINNQKFVGIPHYKLKEKLMYKCKSLGIEFILIEESYTSKCSFIDREDVSMHENYAGKRIKRGLFKSKNNTLLNADINGACNIARKVFPNFRWDDGIEAFIVRPEVFDAIKPSK